MLLFNAIPTSGDPWWTDPFRISLVAGSVATAVLSSWNTWKLKTAQPVQDPQIREARVVKVEDAVQELRQHVDTEVAALRTHLDKETGRLSDQMQAFHLARQNSTESLRLEMKGDVSSLRETVDKNHREIMAVLLKK